MRVVSRSGDTADVDDALDAVRPQKCEEVLPCAGRMPNCQHKGHFALDLSHDEGSPTAEYISLGTLCPCSRCVCTNNRWPASFPLASHWVLHHLLDVVIHETNGVYTLLGFRNRYLFLLVFGSTTGDPRRYPSHWEETLPAKKEHISLLVAESLPPQPRCTCRWNLLRSSHLGCQAVLFNHRQMQIGKP
jgi:hypothetical protein